MGPGSGRLGAGCVSRSGTTKSLMLQPDTPRLRPESNQAFLGHHVSLHPLLPLSNTDRPETSSTEDPTRSPVASSRKKCHIMWSRNSFNPGICDLGVYLWTCLLHCHCKSSWILNRSHMTNYSWPTLRLMTRFTIIENNPLIHHKDKEEKYSKLWSPSA